MQNITIQDIKEKILPVLKHYHVRRAGLFGSGAHGMLKSQSDIDLLVDIKKDISLLEFVELKLKLEETIGRDVDLIEYQTIKPRLKERILDEEIRLL